jgi:hypothetical protein
VHVTYLSPFHTKLMAVRKAVCKRHKHVDASFGFVNNVAPICVLDTTGDANITPVSRFTLTSVLLKVSLKFDLASSKIEMDGMEEELSW